MFEFIHEIIEAWILRLSAGELSPLRRKILEWHLGRCWRCRSFMLDLVEFSHSMEDLKGLPRLGAGEAAELHGRVMASFHAEVLKEKGLGSSSSLPQRPLVRAGFLQALAFSCLVFIGSYIILAPYDLRQSAAGSSSQEAIDNVSKETFAKLEASPTPTPGLPGKSEKSEMGMDQAAPLPSPEP